MILYYVDESGTGFGDRRTPYFVIAAIGIHSQEYHLFDSSVNQLKRELVSWAKPEDFEIKGRDLRRGEMLFRGQSWSARVKAIHDIAQLIADMPCRILAVRLDKRLLPDHVGSDDMYRLAFTRLLEMIDEELSNIGSPGMLMVDARSTLHSAVQDRRLLDAYRDWLTFRTSGTHLLDLPWFGFSAFYVGLQVADFSAYLIDFVSNERVPGSGNSKLYDAYKRFRHKVRLTLIP